MTLNQRTREEIRKAVYQSIGAASMCWIADDTGPDGTFDSEEAAFVAERLVDRMVAILEGTT